MSTEPKIKMKNPKYTPEEMAIARKIYDASDDSGMVSGHGIAPHERPELHGQMLASSLFFALTGKEWDADYLNDRLG